MFKHWRSGLILALGITFNIVNVLSLGFVILSYSGLTGFLLYAVLLMFLVAFVICSN